MYAQLVAKFTNTDQVLSPHLLIYLPFLSYPCPEDLQAFQTSLLSRFPLPTASSVGIARGGLLPWHVVIAVVVKWNTFVTS